jgi:hypothetical protein
MGISTRYQAVPKTYPRLMEYDLIGENVIFLMIDEWKGVCLQSYSKIEGLSR